MNLTYLLNRKVRQVFYNRMGDNILRNKLLQKTLGFKISDSLILDKIPGMKIEYDINSVIGQALFFSGYFEELEIRFFIDILKNDKSPIILDIGANIGLHSLKWSQALSKAEIYSFEPANNTRTILNNNIEANGFAKNIKIFPYAIADKVGFAQFYECDDNAYSSLKDTKRKTVVNIQQVPVTTIDEFVNTHAFHKISLIKIDVEGFETETIKGGINTLQTYKPDLFVEIYGGETANSDPEATVELICSLGYRPYVLIDGTAKPFVKHNDSEYNYFFTFKPTL